MSAALKLVPETDDLSEKPRLGEKRPKPRLVWENPKLSAGRHKEKPKVKPDQSYGRVLYNYFRDYDPSTGRYIESDLIGLDGGVNTFAYVFANPISWGDKFGLQAASGAIPITPPKPIDIPSIPPWARNPIGFCLFAVTFSSNVGEGSDVIPLTSNCHESQKQCDDDDNGRCKKAIQDARSAYYNLVRKRIPSFQSGGAHGRDAGHLKAIQSKRRALEKAIRKVRRHCKPPPAELAEWERVANLHGPGF